MRRAKSYTVVYREGTFLYLQEPVHEGETQPSSQDTFVLREKAGLPYFPELALEALRLQVEGCMWQQVVKKILGRPAHA